MAWISIVVLVLIFVVNALRPINLGLLGLAAAFLIGVLGAGLPAKQVLAGFPGDLFVTIVGITWLFSLARSNGTIDRIVDAAAAFTGQRARLMPVLVFFIAAILTALGALGPAAVAIIAPVALRLARQNGLSPLLMGLATVHGAQAGAFSPISVYGGITNQVMERSGLATDPGYLFLASLIFNAAIALVVFLILVREKVERPLDETDNAAAARTPWTREQLLTIIGLGVLAVCALGFRLDVGLAAVVIVVILAILSPGSYAAGFKGVDWSTALLITGIVTYVGVMQELGTVDMAGHLALAIAAPLVAVLVLCYVAGVVSAFASSTALLGIVIPLSGPLLETGGLNAIAVVAAIAISTTIVDTSPFSTNGALVVANAEEDRRAGLLKALLRYTALIVAVGPLVAWACFLPMF